MLETNYSFVRGDQASFASAAIIVEQREKFPPQLWVSLYFNRHLKKKKPKQNKRKIIKTNKQTKNKTNINRQGKTTKLGP